MFTNEGINTTLRATNEPRRTMEPGTARKPAASKSLSSQPSNLLGTLSHQGPTPPPMVPARRMVLGLSRKLSRIACLAHWWVVQVPSIFSATRSLPASIRRMTSSTAVRTGPLVSVVTPSRAAQAASISVWRSAVVSSVIGVP